MLLKKFGVKSGVQTQSGHGNIDGQIETGDLPAEAPLEMPVQAFGEQPEARRQVVTSPVGIADRRLLLLLGTLTIGLLAASEMTLPWRPDGISVGDAGMFQRGNASCRERACPSVYTPEVNKNL